MTRVMQAAVGAVGLCAALAISPAWSMTSQGSVTWLGVELIDLDPDDGVAPAITFLSPMQFGPMVSLSNQAYSFTPEGDFVAGARNGWASDGVWSPIASSVVQAQASLYNLSGSSAGAQAGDTRFTLTVQGSGLGYEAPGLNMNHPWAYGAAQYQSSVSGALAFSLTANTLATFSFAGDSTVAGATDQAHGSMDLMMQVYTYGTDTASYRHEVLGSFTHQLTVGNLQSREVQGNLLVSAQTTGYFTNAVPEPEALGLLLAGVGVVWVRCATRRRHPE